VGGDAVAGKIQLCESAGESSCGVAAVLSGVDLCFEKAEVYSFSAEGDACLPGLLPFYPAYALAFRAEPACGGAQTNQSLDV